MKITIVVAGCPHEVSAAKRQRLGVVVCKMLAATGHTTLAAAWETRNVDGVLQDHDRTIGQLGLQDGQTLFTNPRAGIGGNTQTGGERCR